MDPLSTLPLQERFWLTVAQAARYAGMGKSTIRQYTYCPDFYPVRRLGGKVRIHRQEFERWLEEQANQVRLTA